MFNLQDMINDEKMSIISMVMNNLRSCNYRNYIYTKRNRDRNRERGLERVWTEHCSLPCRKGRVQWWGGIFIMPFPITKKHDQTQTSIFFLHIPLSICRTLGINPQRDQRHNESFLRPALRGIHAILCMEFIDLFPSHWLLLF